MANDVNSPKYTNGRLRVREEQAAYLDKMLHDRWVAVVTERAAARADDAASKAIRDANRELKLLKGIQAELRRTRLEMGWLGEIEEFDANDVDEGDA